MTILRPYQKAAIEAFYLSKQNKQILALPTGTGKTVIFTHLIAQHVKQGGKALVIAHREELITQAVKKMVDVGGNLRISVEKAESHGDRNSDVVFASVQTLGATNSKRLQRYKPDDFSIIVIDEAHHSTAKTYKNILNYFGVLKGFNDNNTTCNLLGFTATPFRADNEDLSEVFDVVTYSYGLIDSIKNE